MRYLAFLFIEITTQREIFDENNCETNDSRYIFI